MLTHPVFLKIEQATELEDSDREALRALTLSYADYEPGQDIVSEGGRPNTSAVILEGFACRYRSLPNGARQILSFQIPGDWSDLDSYFLRTMDHSVGAIARCRVAHIPHAKVREVLTGHPNLMTALWRDTMVDAAVVREWVVNVGARDAYERMAHLFCEVHARLRSIDAVADGYFEFPVTQADLADATGISVVHANRTLQQLRAAGMIEFSRRRVKIPNLASLHALAGFDPGYLHLTDNAVSAAA